jgi:hypothetical protein
VGVPMWPLSTFAKSRKRFCLVLVKPTHYCDDGYIIQFLRSAIPSNSLACIHGIAQDFAEQKILGDDVNIEIHAFDEATPGFVRSASPR